MFNGLKIRAGWVIRMFFFKVTNSNVHTNQHFRHCWAWYLTHWCDIDIKEMDAALQVGGEMCSVTFGRTVQTFNPRWRRKKTHFYSSVCQRQQSSPERVVEENVLWPAFCLTGWKRLCVGFNDENISLIFKGEGGKRGGGIVNDTWRLSCIFNVSFLLIGLIHMS